MDAAQALKAIDTNVTCKKWASIFKQVLDTEGSSLSWTVNMDAICRDMHKNAPLTATWS